VGDPENLVSNPARKNSLALVNMRLKEVTNFELLRDFEGDRGDW